MVPSWLIIGGVTVLVAVVMARLNTKNGIRWFNRLRRPRWLTFEAAIPVIWTVVFIGGAWSAVVVWRENGDRAQAWSMMAIYLLLEIVTLAYTPVMAARRSLKLGTAIGATGFLIAALLALWVSPVSTWAAVLLLPYLLWSPIGTYTTWEMARLNPADA
ncbi:MAG: TspO/MBR family protein [Oculatellaceae cyanobacterium Prado106]|jgi:tryptophan-rich sensory protein|nr:TspO/MBR family protein [Oculatellaceae cyanobacterium Prado106]